MSSAGHPSPGRPRRAWKASNRRLAAAAGMLGVLLLFCLVYPALSGQQDGHMDMAARLAAPGAAHWLGTDNFGRDLGVRLARGGLLSLLAGIGSIVLAALVGVSLGLVAGYRRGWADAALMAVADVFLAFPAFVLAIAIVAVLGAGVPNLIVALAAVYWPQYARMTRSLVLGEHGKDHIAAARAIGAGPGWIVVRHILPHIAGPLLVMAAFGVGQAIIAESGMSFLGLGVQPPDPSWGWIMAYGLKELRTDPWMSTAAGLALLYTVLAFNLLGEGLRELLDPRGHAAPVATTTPATGARA